MRPHFRDGAGDEADAVAKRGDEAVEDRDAEGGAGSSAAPTISRASGSSIQPQMRKFAQSSTKHSARARSGSGRISGRGRPNGGGCPSARSPRSVPATRSRPPPRSAVARASWRRPAAPAWRVRIAPWIRYKCDHESAAGILVRCVGLLYADYALAGSCGKSARYVVAATSSALLGARVACFAFGLEPVREGDLGRDAMGFAWLTNHLFS